MYCKFVIKSLLFKSFSGRNKEAHPVFILIKVMVLPPGHPFTCGELFCLRTPARIFKLSVSKFLNISKKKFILKAYTLSKTSLCQFILWQAPCQNEISVNLFFRYAPCQIEISIHLFFRYVPCQSEISDHLFFWYGPCQYEISVNLFYRYVPCQYEISVHLFFLSVTSRNAV